MLLLSSCHVHLAATLLRSSLPGLGKRGPCLVSGGSCTRRSHFVTRQRRSANPRAVQAPARHSGHEIWKGSGKGQQGLFLASQHSIPDLPGPGIKPVSPELGAQSLNHWTARKVQDSSDFNNVFVTREIHVQRFLWGQNPHSEVPAESC